MQRFVIGIIILCVSVWIGLLIAKDPGMALFTYNHWSVEMPLWFAVSCLILFVIIFYFFMRLLNGIDSSFYRWRNWRRWRKKNKAYSKTNRGLIELIEGQWRHAENDLLEGIEQSDAPLVNYLAAAKAAHERGAFDKRDAYLKRAHDLSPQADVAIGLTQAQLQFDQGQLEQSLATLSHVRNVVPLHPIMLKLLEKLYIRLADWKGLLKLLPSLRKAKIYTQIQLNQLETHVYIELLASVANKSGRLESFKEFWANVPRWLQKNPQLIARYAQQLVRFPNEAHVVEELINKVLKKTWDPELVKIYGLLITDDPKKQLSHAEKWLRMYPNQAVLLLTLGRLCVRCQLWGKARSYFEDSLKLESRLETYVEYGKLLEHLGDSSSALQNYREGLELAP